MRTQVAMMWIGILASAGASAADGYTCTATGSWALCAESDAQCTSHAVEEAASRTEESDARDAAVQACRQETGVQRVRASFLADADTQAGDATRVESACIVQACEATAVDANPYADAFDEPVCIAVRQYICSICGDPSPLCRQVQSEQPVTADACSQTHARLATFSDLLGQVDSLQPGTWTDARRELCGISAAQ